MEEEVETLDAIEVPGTAVVQEERSIIFPKPNPEHALPIPKNESITPITFLKPLPQFHGSRTLRDPIASIKGTRTSVRPAKAERPPYPRFAREQGWEGVVVLRLVIGADGEVRSVQTSKSSGHPILDESAEQAVHRWRFDPAKDGEIPVPVTVDLPIRFDLDK
jgi:TonB family protein